MKKVIFFLAIFAISLGAIGQNNDLMGKRLYLNPVKSRANHISPRPVSINMSTGQIYYNDTLSVPYLSVGQIYGYGPFNFMFDSTFVILDTSIVGTFDGFSVIKYMKDTILLLSIAERMSDGAPMITASVLDNANNIQNDLVINPRGTTISSDYNFTSGGFYLVNSDARFSAMPPVRFNGFATNYDDSTILINGLLSHPISGKLVTIGSIDTTGNFNYNHSWLSIDPRGSMRLDIGSNDSLLDVGYRYIWVKDTISYESHTCGEARKNYFKRTYFGLTASAVIRDIGIELTDSVMYFLSRSNKAASDDTLWMIDTRDSSIYTRYKSVLDGKKIENASDSIYLINAGTGIASYMLKNSVIRIKGNGAATDITANPQITPGNDYQIIQIWGEDDTNTVTFDDGNGLQLRGGVSVILGLGDYISFQYFPDVAVWRQMEYSDN